MSKASKLEALELEQARLARLRAEQARDEVVESAGKMLDQAREDPEVEVDEENTSVKELSKKTGRSGDKYAAVADPSPKPS